MMKRKTAIKFMALILCSVTLLNAAALYGCKKEEEIAPEVAQRVTEEIGPEVAQRITNVYRSDFLSFRKIIIPPANCLILTADCICHAKK